MTDLNSKDVHINEDFIKEELNIEELKGMLTSEQFEKIESILKNAYEDTEILSSWVLSCIELLNDEHAEIVYLPENLKVSKKGNTLEFKFKHKVNKLILLLFVAAFAISAMGATYWSLYYLNNINLNKDIDGDGISDINIDYDNDRKAEINVDTNKDNKPDINIDYKGNRKAVFNIDKDNDRKPDFNLVNNAYKNKSCTINCDLNNDGWPDINIDLDGDGKPDVDIDTNHDNIPDINLDTNGDGKCDLMCDSNHDNKCDYFCVKPQVETKTDTNTETENKDKEDNTSNNSNTNDVVGKRSGPTTISGDPSVNLQTFYSGELIITYSDNEAISTNVLPNDMSESKPLPDKAFTIENTSNYPQNYKLVWKINKNEFKTSNLKYKLVSNNNGANLDWQVLPNKDSDVERHITIAANSKQEYTISFEFVGTHSEQNIDKNKEFSGYITADYDD